MNVYAVDAVNAVPFRLNENPVDPPTISSGGDGGPAVWLHVQKPLCVKGCPKVIEAKVPPVPTLVPTLTIIWPP